MLASDPCKNSSVKPTHSDHPEMVKILAGEFFMGGVSDDKFVSAVELPPQKIVFEKPFALSKTPITEQQWGAVMGQNSSSKLPITRVNYQEVLTYLHRLSKGSHQAYRLPSEAEWEYACRAGTTTVIPHGKQITLTDANFLYDESGNRIGTGRLSQVDTFPPNAFGLHDMLGNVCEWTADLWQPHHDNAVANGSPRLLGGKAGHRTIRGGAWDHLPRILRPSWRDWAPESARWDNLGFRLALDL